MKNDVESLSAAQILALARFCREAMVVINARLFTLFGLLLCAGAFGFAIWQPEYPRIVAACAFAVLVFWPLQRMEAKRLIVTQRTEEP